jgi:hypothetical protein
MDVMVRLRHDVLAFSLTANENIYTGKKALLGADFAIGTNHAARMGRDEIIKSPKGAARAIRPEKSVLISSQIPLGID